MGIIVCQSCNTTIEHFENEKVSVYYGKCPNCKKEKIEDSK